MRNSLLIKFNPFFVATILAIVSFVLLILFSKNDLYWYYLLFILTLLQAKFRFSVSSLFPLVAILSLTEYYFLFSGKRAYLCELVYIPLFINYLLTGFSWRRPNSTHAVVFSLFFVVILFQGFNFLINSDITSSLFRIRTLAFPLLLIVMVRDSVRTKEDLKRIIRIILIVSVVASFIVYLQFFTGEFYLLQETSAATEGLNIGSYLSSTEDSYLFSLIGLHIKGPIPPVGLNYFKFGFSEITIVPASLFFSLFKFQKNKTRYIYLLLFFFLFSATLLTGSRSVLLTLLFIVWIIHLFYKGKLKWGFILSIIFFVFAITYVIGPLLSIINLSEFGTLASRMFYMDDFYKFIQNYPQVLFAGSSPDSYLNLTGSGQPPHHFFAFGVIYDGIIVTISLFFIFYRLLRTLRTINSNDSELLEIRYGLWASLFGFVFIYGQTTYLTWSIPHNSFFCIVIGLLLASDQISKRGSMIPALKKI